MLPLKILVKKRKEKINSNLILKTSMPAPHRFHTVQQFTANSISLCTIITKQTNKKHMNAQVLQRLLKAI